MNPVIAAAIAQGMAALIEIWRTSASKSPEWVPSPAEWDALLLLNEKSAEQYKEEAAALLGLPWPPPSLI
jgi:hypothetical protein